MELAQVRQLIDDLDQLLGLNGNFWPVEASSSTEVLETPEQLEALFHALLVDLFGLKVEGL